jgi:F420-dependent oxidoreductase-like protein
MRLGIALGAPGGTLGVQDMGRLAQEAERLNFATAWTAEAYGGDAATTLGWLAAKTSRIGLGSAVLQIPARTPAMTAMTAVTLDLLSEGRFHLGLGVSGPAVSEGWHGARFSPSLARTREYVEIVRTALSGERVDYQGAQFSVPLAGTGHRPLRLSARPARSLPIYLAAVGPKATELAGEIADGWLAAFFSPEHSVGRVAAIRAARAAAERPDRFEVVATVPIWVADDPVAAADNLRDYFALYIGGMGTRERNFYNLFAREIGYEEQAVVIQDLFLGRDRAGAAAAVPFALMDETALVGPKEHLAERLRAYAGAGVDTVTLWPFGQPPDTAIAALRTAASALELAGVGD